MYDMEEAIYARQSIDKKDSISIETQIEFGRRRCQGDNVQVYVDKGYSGKNTNRPEYIRLFQNIEAGRIHRVIVYRLDRFSRSLIDFCIAWEIMSKHRVEFISVNENFDTSTPVGKAMVYIVMIFAQMEREVIGERIKDNYYSRTGEGHWPGGPAPYGFTLCKRVAMNGKNYASIEFNSSIHIVERISKAYIELEYSLSRIRTELNEERVPSYYGTTWSSMSVSRVLKNPVYVKADITLYSYFKELGIKIVNPMEEFTGERGILIVGRNSTKVIASFSEKNRALLQVSLGSWPGILDSGLWIAIQRKLRDNIPMKNNGKSKNTWLSGVMKCAECGKAVVPIVRKGSTKHPLYCSGHMQHGCDKMIRLYLDSVEDEVEQALEEMLEKCSIEPVDEELTVISNEVKIKIMQIEEQIQRLVASISTGVLEDVALKYVNEEIKKLNRNKEELYTQVITVRKQVYLKELVFSSLGFEERKIVVKNFIKRICVFEDDFSIEWKV